MRGRNVNSNAPEQVANHMIYKRAGDAARRNPESMRGHKIEYRRGLSSRVRVPGLQFDKAPVCEQFARRWNCAGGLLGLTYWLFWVNPIGALLTMQNNWE